MLVSAVQQHESAVSIHISPPSWAFQFWRHLLSFKQRSLCTLHPALLVWKRTLIFLSESTWMISSSGKSFWFSRLGRSSCFCSHSLTFFAIYWCITNHNYIQWIKYSQAMISHDSLGWSGGSSALRHFDCSADIAGRSRGRPITLDTSWELSWSCWSGPFVILHRDHPFPEWQLDSKKGHSKRPSLIEQVLIKPLLVPCI